MEDVFDLVRQARRGPGESDDDPTIELEGAGPVAEAPTNIGGQRLLTGTPSLSNLNAHPDAHPIALELLWLRHFGPQFIEWEPETIELRAPEVRAGVLSPQNYAKLMGCKTLSLVDTFWERWEAFAWIASALNGVQLDAKVLHVPSVWQCLLACDVAARVRDDVPWSEEVRQFVSQVFRFESVLLPLSPCDFAPGFDDLGLPVNLKSVRAAWPEVRASGKAPEGDTPEFEQLRRLLVLQRELDESRSSLATQLRMVEIHVPLLRSV